MRSVIIFLAVALTSCGKDVPIADSTGGGSSGSVSAAVVQACALFDAKTNGPSHPSRQTKLVCISTIGFPSMFGFYDDGTAALVGPSSSSVVLWGMDAAGCKINTVDSDGTAATFSKFTINASGWITRMLYSVPSMALSADYSCAVDFDPNFF